MRVGGLAQIMSLADTATADIAAEAQVRTEKGSGRVLAAAMD